MSVATSAVSILSFLLSRLLAEGQGSMRFDGSVILIQTWHNECCLGVGSNIDACAQASREESTFYLTGGGGEEKWRCKELLGSGVMRVLLYTWCPGESKSMEMLAGCGLVGDKSGEGKLLYRANGGEWGERVKIKWKMNKKWLKLGTQETFCKLESENRENERIRGVKKYLSQKNIRIPSNRKTGIQTKGN